jgi:hypothetical protein
MNNLQPWWLMWPVAEVAAAILPLFSYSPCVDEEAAIENIVSWCETGSYRKAKVFLIVRDKKQFEDPDIRAIAEAIQVLEHAALLMRTVDGVAHVVVGLTRLGVHALQTNTVRQHLGLGDAPPRA